MTRKFVAIAGLLGISIMLGATCQTPSGPTAGVPLPALGAWMSGSGQPTIPQIFAGGKYNFIVYVFASGSDSSGTVQLFSYNGSSLPNDISAWHTHTDKKGHSYKITLSVVDGFSGAGSAHYLNSTNATNAFNSISSIVTANGFDGIEWDLEGGEGTTWNKTTIESINSQLKTKFGSGFLIGQAPRPFELHAGSTKRGWMSTFDYSAIQYYFVQGQGGPFDCSNILALEGGTDGNSEGLAQFVNGQDSGITVAASKIILGNMVTGTGQTGCTPSQYETAWASLVGTFPALGGDQVWQSAVDAGNNFSFSSAFAGPMGLQ